MLSTFSLPAPLHPCTCPHLVTDTGSEEGGREAAEEEPSEGGRLAKAGRRYLHQGVTITTKSP